jgi:tRNA (guanine10-N2)-dimethyltransferase
MQYLFELSGESPALALEELAALFYPNKINIIKNFNDFVLLESDLKEIKVREIAGRSAFLHSAAVVVAKLKSLLLKELDKVGWSFVEIPFCVRAIDLTGAEFPGIEARLAGPIYDYFAHHKGGNAPFVSLEKPKTTVLFVITKKEIYATKLLWKVSRGRFMEREPIKKPAFHPTSLKPKLARLLVNLSRAKKSNVLLDPFCGMGGVLVEAAILGCKPVGVDIDEEMTKGSKTNLNFYKQKAKIYLGDALKIEETLGRNSVDAIAIDPPYGRSTKIGAKNIHVLYRDFMSSAHKVLKKKKFVALLYPDSINAKKLMNKKQWNIIFESSLYVHGGLTRKFLILQKK